MKLRAPEALGDSPRKAMVCPTNAQCLSVFPIQ